MSYTELHSGKLRKLRFDMDIEEFKEWLETKEGFEVEDFDEKIEDEYEFFEVRDKSKKYKEPMYIKYVYNKGNLYEMTEHSGGESNDYAHITIVNKDETINFTYLFHNGGTCFSEMLEEGLNKINK